MGNGQGQGSGNKPPQDDRTLLDPLSNDELRALREARQRMQAKKEPAVSAVAHQIVIGPDSGDDIGDAPTRAIPSLPSFDSQVSLDQISAPQQRVTGGAVDPASQPRGEAPRAEGPAPNPPVGSVPSDPMSVLSDAETIVPAAAGHDASQNTVPSGLSAPPKPPDPTQPPSGNTNPGFGENTLLWMQPPKMPQSSLNNPPLTGTADFIPRADPREVAVGRAKTIGAFVVVLLLIGSLVYLSLFSAAKGVIEVHSTPSKADVYIDGNKYESTPVKLTLAEGNYRISLRLDGYETAWFMANIEADKSQRKNVDLVPLSRAGLMTVKIEVQPVAARISVDGQAYDGRRTLMVPNVDPLESHKIMIEAAGYVKVIQDVRPDELKSSYSFVLAKSSE
ncbi:MAG: PEGA domain-containing protein [Myxococcota bacterium]